MERHTSLKRWMIIGCFFGAFAFVIICGVKFINPFNYEWILSEKSDTTVSFFSWIFYQKASFSEGIFYNDYLTYPSKLSMIFSEVIAPLALPIKPVFKLVFRNDIPTQIIGIWSLLCLILQGLFAAILLFKITNNNLTRICGIIVLSFSSVMIQRLLLHNTLVANWLILAAICMYEYRNELKEKWYLLWAPLFLIATMTHLYFVPILMLIFIPSLVVDFISRKSIVKPALSFLSSVAVSFLIVWIMGGFSSEIAQADPEWGYTVLYKYSSNLLFGFISLGKALLFPEIKGMPEEYEGYAYLGIGAILTLVMALIIRIVRYAKGERCFSNDTFFYIACIILSIIAAVGPLVTFGEIQLLLIPIPDYLNHLFATFRSIGRYVWVAYYMIIVLVFRVLGNEMGRVRETFHERMLSAFLVTIVILQVVDLSPMIAEKRRISTNNEKWTSTMESPRWGEVGDSFDNIFVVTSARTSYPSQEYYSMCLYAYENDMKLSSSYFAHMNERLMKEISLGYFREILEGNPRERVLYWFENEDYYTQASEKIHCEVIDGYYVGWVEND